MDISGIPATVQRDFQCCGIRWDIFHLVSNKHDTKSCSLISALGFNSFWSSNRPFQSYDIKSVCDGKSDTHLKETAVVFLVFISKKHNILYVLAESSGFNSYKIFHIFW